MMERGRKSIYDPATGLIQAVIESDMPGFIVLNTEQHYCADISHECNPATHTVNPATGAVIETPST